MTTRELLSTEEAAALLHLHPKRVQQLARSGKLPAVRHGRRWLFRREQLIGAPAPRVVSAGQGIDLSARNQLRGVVRSIQEEGMLVEIVLTLEPQELVAIITRSSAERLGFAPGVPVLGVVKASDVMVARELDE